MILFYSLYIIVFTTLLVQSFNSAQTSNFQYLANPLQTGYQRNAFPESKDSSTSQEHVNQQIYLNGVKKMVDKLLHEIIYPNKKRETMHRVNKLSPYKNIKKKYTINNNAEPKWSSWTEWSACSVSCGKGREIRWRHCLLNCNGVETEMEEKTCQLPACGGKLFGLIKL